MPSSNFFYCNSKYIFFIIINNLTFKLFFFLPLIRFNIIVNISKVKVQIVNY